MNPYGIIAVNPKFNEQAEYDLAMAYIAFITSNEGQRLIGDYKFDGEPLFNPDA
jgi:tungstate transport system substrate-binding protein